MSYVLPSLTGLAYFKRDRTVDEKSSQEDELEDYESDEQFLLELVEQYKRENIYERDEGYLTERKRIEDEETQCEKDTQGRKKQLLEEKAHAYAIDKLNATKERAQHDSEKQRIYAESEEKSIRDARNTRPSTSPR
jgi:hypothetical protein